MIVSSMTSIEPDVGQDWLYVHSPRTSALAGLANSANSIAGIIISQRECGTSGHAGCVGNTIFFGSALLAGRSRKA
jgi:hypothetical protein